MGESPLVALRRKKQSSIRIGVDLVKQGEAQAFVSAGNTGAVMTTALVVLGALPGVERPAIAAVVPTLTGQAVLLDVGANVDCKARHLVQFALMGNVYARDVLGLPRPRVGLLSIGEEESKGNELTREAFTVLLGGELAQRGYAFAVHGQAQWNGVAIVSRAGLEDVRAGLPGEPGFPEPEARAGRVDLSEIDRYLESLKTG